MKIGKPEKIGSWNAPCKGRYKALWDAVADLKDGEIIPVTFDTPQEAITFKAACYQRSGRNPQKLITHARKENPLTVWVGKRKEKP